MICPVCADHLCEDGRQPGQALTHEHKTTSPHRWEQVAGRFAESGTFTFNLMCVENVTDQQED